MGADHPTANRSGADRRGGTAGLDRWLERSAFDLGTSLELAGRIRPLTLARDQVLPVADELATFLPGAGLRRGTTLAVGGRGGVVSLALALVAEASTAGSWTASVGVAGIGLVAAASAGLSLDRLAVVDRPPDVSAWATTVATLVEAFDVVLVRPPRRVPTGQARRLASRAREQGAVVVQVGGDPRWGLEPDLRLTIVRSQWQGLGDGHGHLRSRRVTVESSGRRDASLLRRCDFLLPAPDGRPRRVTVESRPESRPEAVGPSPMAVARVH